MNCCRRRGRWTATPEWDRSGLPASSQHKRQYPQESRRGVGLSAIATSVGRRDSTQRHDPPLFPDLCLVCYPMADYCCRNGLQSCPGRGFPCGRTSSGRRSDSSRLRTSDNRNGLRACLSGALYVVEPLEEPFPLDFVRDYWLNSYSCAASSEAGVLSLEEPIF